MGELRGSGEGVGGGPLRLIFGAGLFFGAMFGHFLLIFLCFEQKRAERKTCAQPWCACKSGNSPVPKSPFADLTLWHPELWSANESKQAQKGAKKRKRA